MIFFACQLGKVNCVVFDICLVPCFDFHEDPLIIVTEYYVLIEETLNKSFFRNVSKSKCGKSAALFKWRVSLQLEVLFRRVGRPGNEEVGLFSGKDLNNSKFLRNTLAQSLL